MVIWGGQGGRAGAGLWIGLADSWAGPYKQYEAPEINSLLPQVEDPAIFRDPRGNLHMLTNANSGHSHCHAGGACGNASRLTLRPHQSNRGAASFPCNPLPSLVMTTLPRNTSLVGGHSWSRDGLSWSPIQLGAFGPNTKLTNGSIARLGFVERPQVAQEMAGSPPLALFLGTGHTSWAPFS